MKILRIYSDTNGDTHLEDVEIEMQDLGESGRKSREWAVESVSFREIAPGASAEFHTAPIRQLAINLSGETELKVSDGTLRRIGPGQVFLVEDVTGKGHANRWLDDKIHEIAFLPLTA
jgi:quercetin dioxygenase-like cupin family protein